MATPVTLVITFCRQSLQPPFTESAPANILTVPLVDSWDVVGSFLTYKVGGITKLIPNTRIHEVSIS